MTVPEIIEIAIPALTGIATILRLTIGRHQTISAPKKRAHIVVIDNRSAHRTKNTRCKPVPLDGRDFDHCTSIDI